MTDNIAPDSDKTEQARRRVGAYAKLLGNYASDDAIIEAGEAAELLFVRGLAFCATSDADGFITDAQVTRYVGAGMKDAAKRAERLAVVGVWERLDGGYLVRSWTKIHETAAAKGRRRKADRERKRKDAESNEPSEPIPAGIQTEGAPESLSMTVQGSDTTAHSTTAQVEVPSREYRNEPLRAVPATDLPPDDEPTPAAPADARCTAHRGVANPPPCAGCAAARQRAERKADVAQERHQRAEAERIANCPDCHGSHWTEADDSTPSRKCTHPHARRTA